MTQPLGQPLRGPGPRLYGHVLISCPQQFCKTGFIISPIFQIKRLRSSLLPLAPSHRLPHTEGSELVARERKVGLLDQSTLTALQHHQVRAGRESRGRGTWARKAKDPVALGDPKGQAAENWGPAPPHTH